MNQTQQFISVKELKDDGYSQYKINQLISSGKLEKVNKNRTVNNFVDRN